jgi:hypothetical protein
MFLHLHSRVGLSSGLIAFAMALVLGNISLAQRPKSSAELLLKNEHGPWLVLAASFEGEGAKAKAVQLAVELRTDFRLKAYCLPKMFDYSRTVAGAGFDENGSQKKMRYQDDRVVESCAVLVGDFDSIEAKDIDDTLNTIKTIRPKFFAQPGAASSAGEMGKVSANDYRNYLKRLIERKNEPEEKNLGPMKYAFKTRNPLLPAEYFKAPTIDKFVKDLNRQPNLNEFNLLDCKGSFTVRILTLRGSISYESWGRSDNPNQASQLEMAAEQAYLVTKALRAAGYEAYQFHDRQQSIVTVGSFNNLGTEKQDKTFQYDTAIQQVMERFKGTDKVTQSAYGVTQTPRLLLELVDQTKIPELTTGTRKEQLDNFRKLSVAFDIAPLPIMAPKLEAKTIYSGYALGK